MSISVRSGGFLVGLMVGAAITAVGAYLGLDQPAPPPPAASAAPTNDRPAPPPANARLRSLGRVPITELSHVGPAALSPGGRLAAVGGLDGKVLLYDLLRDRPVRVVKGHEGEVRDLRFTARAKALVTAGADGKVQALSVPLLKRQLVLRHGGAPVRGVCMAGRLLAVAAEQSEVELIPLAGGPARKLKGHEGWVRAVAATPAGDLLASGGHDARVRLWKLPGGEPARTLEGHRLWVNALAFSPDGKLLASAGFDRAVRLWDPRSGERVRALSGHGRAVTSLHFSPDGGRLASASLDRTAAVWQVSSGEELARIRGHRYQLNRALFGPEGRRLVTASGDGYLGVTPMPTPLPASAAPLPPPAEGALILRRNTSGERAVVQLMDSAGEPTEAGLAALAVVMRSGPDDLVHPPDPKLARLLYRVAEHFGRQREITVVSGYRSPSYNLLRSKQSKQVGKKSAHMQGKAIDIRISGVTITRLRDYLKKLKAGGVGFYADSRFVHMDIRPHRYWEGD